MLASNSFHDDDITNAPTPQEMAEWLRTHFAEGEALDLLRKAGERWGWTNQLNECGTYYLKAHARDISPEEARKA